VAHAAAGILGISLRDRGRILASAIGAGQAGQKRPLIIWVAAFAMPTGKEDLKFKTYSR
jgi:stage V sporulation protein SpoVS